MRVGRSVVVEAVDVDAALELLAGLLQAWRELPFEDGRYVDLDGKPRAALRVEAGSHPVPGVRYRLEVAEGEDTTVVRADLVEDSVERVAVRLEAPGEAAFVVDAEVTQPARPNQLWARVSGTAGDHWLTGSEWSADVTVDREQLLAHGRAGRPITVRVLHRLASGVARVGTTSRPDDRWEMTVDLDLRARGCLRPFAAIAGFFARRIVGTELEAFLEGLPEGVEALNRELAAVEAEGVDAVAPRILREQLADLLIQS